MKKALVLAALIMIVAGSSSARAAIGSSLSIMATAVLAVADGVALPVSQYFSDDAETIPYYFDDAETDNYETED